MHTIKELPCSVIYLRAGEVIWTTDKKTDLSSILCHIYIDAASGDPKFTPKISKIIFYTDHRSEHKAKVMGHYFLENGASPASACAHI